MSALMCQFRWLAPVAINGEGPLRKACRLLPEHDGPHRDGSYWVARHAEDSVQHWKPDTVAALYGATNEPAPESRVGNAGEFAARWNTLDSAAREMWFQLIQQNGVMASRCVVEDHYGAVQALNRLSLEDDEVLQKACRAHYIAQWGDDLDPEHVFPPDNVAAMRAAIEVFLNGVAR
jgi:hypothetical protein